MPRLLGLAVPASAPYGALVVQAPDLPPYEWEGVTVGAFRWQPGGDSTRPRYAIIRPAPLGLSNLPGLLDPANIGELPRIVLSMRMWGILTLLGIAPFSGDRHKPQVALFDQLLPGEYELVLTKPVRKRAYATVYPGKIAYTRFAA